jgi:hypothetical protein
VRPSGSASPGAQGQHIAFEPISCPRPSWPRCPEGGRSEQSSRRIARCLFRDESQAVAPVDGARRVSVRGVLERPRRLARQRWQ